MKCPECEKDITPEASFCHHCGARLAVSEEDAPRHPLRASGKQAANEPERELWQGSFSKLAMIGSWAGALAFTLLMLLWAVAARFSGTGWLVTLGVLALVWIGLVLRLFYLKLSRHYYLTSQRFSHEQGLLWRQTDRIEAIDIDDVSFSQGPVERMVGVGTIRIMSSDNTDPAMVLPGIENVRAVASLIDEARRTERRKRGLYVESV